MESSDCHIGDRAHAVVDVYCFIASCATSILKRLRPAASPARAVLSRALSAGSPYHGATFWARLANLIRTDGVGAITKSFGVVETTAFLVALTAGLLLHELGCVSPPPAPSFGFPNEPWWCNAERVVREYVERG